MLKNLVYGLFDPVRRWLKVRKEFFATAGKVVLDIGAGDWRRGNVTLDRDRSHRPDVCGDAVSLPIRTESVDEVVCYHLGEHLHPAEFEQTIREMHRVLKPGGSAYLLVDREFSEDALFEKDPTHVHRYTEDEIRDLLDGWFEVDFSQSFNLVGAVNRFGPLFWRYLNDELKYYLELTKPGRS